MDHAARPRSTHRPHAALARDAEQRHAAAPFALARGARRDAFETGVEQREALDALGGARQHFERDPPAHRMARQREPGRRRGQRLLGHPSECVGVAMTRDQHRRASGEGGALRLEYRLIAQQAGDEHERGQGHSAVRRRRRKGCAIVAAGDLKSTRGEDRADFRAAGGRLERV